MTKHLLEPKVHIFIEKNERFLFLKRHNTGCYDGYWCLPTGRVEEGEAPIAAAKRETLEEVGLVIEPKFRTTVCAKVPDVLSKTKEDYEDLCFFFSGELSGYAKNCEPEKHNELQWFSLKNLPSPIMPVVKFGINCFLKQKPYGEFGYSREVLTDN